MTKTEDMKCRKDLFNLPTNKHYLNCAFMSPLPKVAEEAGVEGMRQKRDPSLLNAQTFMREADSLRAAFAKLVNAPDTGRIAIIPGVSYATATLAKNTDLRHGQNVVVVKDEFPSDFYCWRNKARDAGAELRVVAPPDRLEGRAEAWNERILDAIDANTAVVTAAQVHWADGTLFDLQAIRKRSREVGAALILDGAQSIGAYPMDIEALDPDAVIAPGYKWMLGPYSTGLTYYGPRYDNGVPIEETWLGRVGSEDYSRLTEYTEEYAPGARRYDVAQRTNLTLTPMLTASIRLLTELGVANIQSYCEPLADLLTAEISGLGLHLESRPHRLSHLFGIRFGAGVDSKIVAAALADRNVFVSIRAGVVLRVSINIFNDEADVMALAAGLKAALG